MSMVIECKNGLQLEVIVRKHRKGAPQYTNPAELSDKDAKQVEKAIKKAVDEPASE